MKTRLLVFTALLAFVASGCSHLDLSAPGSEDRVLNGLVSYDLETPLPPDAVITVRVIDLSNPSDRFAILGETTIEHPATTPIPFRVEYHATDEQLMRRVSVDVRISFGGKLHFHTVGGNPVTLGNFNDTHVIRVVPLR
jgi:uncharacterized lipoprotein YbaY